MKITIDGIEIVFEASLVSCDGQRMISALWGIIETSVYKDAERVWIASRKNHCDAMTRAIIRYAKKNGRKPNRIKISGEIECYRE